MSYIDLIQQKVQPYFQHLSGKAYLRMMDTPHIWGLPFGKEIMPRAIARQAEFERAVEEIIQKSKYRCDIASLNSPDPDWGKIVLGAIDTAMSAKMARTAPTQFRFLFGQTPMYPLSEPPNFTDFKAALIRLIRQRSGHWEQMPEIWMGRFYRLEEGILSSIKTKIFGDSIISSDDTKMTWNHCKIIVMDGTEALVGGHNLNMDLFRSYPPVHDASVIVHGEAAYGAQAFLNNMWNCGTDLLTKEYLDISKLVWVDKSNAAGKPNDPLRLPEVAAYIKERQEHIIQIHEQTIPPPAKPPTTSPVREIPAGIREQDLQTLADLNIEVFEERRVYTDYAKMEEYKPASRMLAVGKYWKGPNKEKDYQKASEIMKKELILNARKIIRMSQMDLISAWKTNWADHVVCHWIIEALLKNAELRVQVVVSPLDAGAGAEGDQYSFGSGAGRTFELIKYYMTHTVETDTLIADNDGKRQAALKRIYIAPFYYTDQVPENKTVEGKTYQWPDLSPEGYTSTLKQPPLSERPPKKGVISSLISSMIKGSGMILPKVPSAPGNHSKIMIVDDELYVVGSDNLYPGSLSEFNYLVEGKQAVEEMLRSYWNPLWRYSAPHAYRVEPVYWKTRLFAAVQANDQTSLLFSIGTNGNLYLLKSGLANPWQRLDISSDLVKAKFSGQKDISCRTFDVSQHIQDRTLSLALAVKTPEGDQLFISTRMANSSTQNTAPDWIAYPFDDVQNKVSKLEIVNIYICQATNEGQYIFVDIVRNNDSAIKTITRYYIDVAANKGSYWRKHDLPIDIQAGNYNSCLGRLKKGYVDGLYTIGDAGSRTQLVYCPVVNVYGDGPATPIRLNLPDNVIASAIASVRNADLSTDLLAVSGRTLYYFSASNQADGAVGLSVLSNDCLSNVKQIFAQVHGNQLAVWVLNYRGELVYISCQKNENSSSIIAASPVVMLFNIEDISPYVNTGERSHILFASGERSLQRIVLDPLTGSYEVSDIEI